MRAVLAETLLIGSKTKLFIFSINLHYLMLFTVSVCGTILKMPLLIHSLLQNLTMIAETEQDSICTFPPNRLLDGTSNVLTRQIEPNVNVQKI